MKIIKEKELYSFCYECLLKYNMSEEDSKTVSMCLVKTDKWGINTHGTKNLYGYINKNIAGGVSFKDRPVIEKEYTSMALIDANNTLGYIPATMAMNIACDKAEKSGIAIAVVKNSCHYGAGALYANIASDRGMIGIAISNVDKKMTIPGARGMVIGHNPFSLSAPANILPSIFLDASSSNVSSLKVLTAKAKGTEIPNNWICDKDGMPTNDPSKYPDEGALLPMGNHKGYGIALFIDILTGVIASSLNSISNDIPSWCFDIEVPNKVSHTFIAINPNLLCENFKERIDELIESIHSFPKASNVEKIYVPGEMEWNKYMATENGKTINLPDDVFDELEKLSRLAGVDLKVL
ncbi:MAG: Ldh family oxidoreductase [Bacilli bacterium]|nr:Ldh family oxidoreductase [Bacilli bacterium]